MVDKSKAKSHKLWNQNNKSMNGVLNVPKDFYDYLMGFYNGKSLEMKKFGEIRMGDNGSVYNHFYIPKIIYSSMCVSKVWRIPTKCFWRKSTLHT